jgi:hypothetical protein
MRLLLRGVPGQRALLALLSVLAVATGTGCIKGEVGELPIPVITHPDDRNT